jgi:hypothetical protein
MTILFNWMKFLGDQLIMYTPKKGDILLSSNHKEATYI